MVAFADRPAATPSSRRPLRRKSLSPEDAYEYTPYGVVEVYTSPGNDGNWFTSDDTTGNYYTIKTRFTYTGQGNEPESQWMYYKNRYYSPVRGRFVQRDPSGYADEANLYWYARSSPLVLVDPYGLQAACPCVAEPEKCFFSIALGKKYEKHGHTVPNANWFVDAGFNTATIVVLKHLTKPTECCHIYQDVFSQEKIKFSQETT